MQELEQRSEQAPVSEAPTSSGDSQVAALVAAASALALSACGGGEEGGSYGGGGGAARIPPTPIPPAPAPGPLPPPPQDVVPTTHAEAARFAYQQGLVASPLYEGDDEAPAG